MNFKNILVVCIGNICRSPMAEYFLKHDYPERQICSAGLGSLAGHPADPKALLAMQQFSINLEPHIAQQINDQLVKQADLILVMSSSQQKQLEQNWPYAKGKVFRLGHWQNKNIADPYQHEQSVFDETCALIKACVADWKKYI